MSKPWNPTSPPASLWARIHSIISSTDSVRQVQKKRPWSSSLALPSPVRTYRSRSRASGQVASMPKVLNPISSTRKRSTRAFISKKSRAPWVFSPRETMRASPTSSLRNSSSWWGSERWGPSNGLPLASSQSRTGSSGSARRGTVDGGATESWPQLAARSTTPNRPTRWQLENRLIVEHLQGRLRGVSARIASAWRGCETSVRRGMARRTPPSGEMPSKGRATGVHLSARRPVNGAQRGTFPARWPVRNAPVTSV